MLQALLVDDSLGSLRTLRNLLKRYCPQVNIVGEADNIEKAYELILHRQPNLLLLDIEMPAGTGFQLLEQARSMEFEVIFITAHEQYAMQAIKQDAVDYILKPVGHISLMEAIKRAESRLMDRKHAERNTGTPTHVVPGNKLAIPTSKGYEFLAMHEILYLMADGIYSKVILPTQKYVLTTLRLGEMEDKLDAHHFFRIHRSYIIHMRYIKKYHRGDGGYVIMEDGCELPVARNRKDSFLRWLE